MRKPNFMCLGAAKCGTTTLYDILKTHSDIYVTSFKEPHFFDVSKNYNKGFNWYLREYYKGIENQSVIAEFTPSYLAMPNTPRKIYDTIGSDIKFLVVLRNPVERAYSQYLHAKRDMIETLSFEESLEAESERMTKFVSQEDDISAIRFSYILGGLYYRSLTSFFEIFDRSQFKVVIFEEEFMHNRSDLVSEILSFLNLKNEGLEVNIQSNQAAGTRFPMIKKLLKGDSKVRKVMKKLVKSKTLRNKLSYFLQKISNKEVKKESLCEDVKAKVTHKYFMDDILELEKLIGRDLSVWYKDLK